MVLVHYLFSSYFDVPVITKTMIQNIKNYNRDGFLHSVMKLLEVLFIYRTIEVLLA